MQLITVSFTMIRCQQDSKKKVVCSFQFIFFRQLFSIIIYFLFQFILLKFAYHFIVHLFQFTNLPNLLANYNPLNNFAFQIIKFYNFIHSNL